MKLWEKIALGTVIGGGIYAAYRYASGLKRTEAELQSVVSIDSVTGNIIEGAHVEFNVRLKNPTAGSFKIKRPFVEFLYKDSVVGSSNALNEDITLPAYGEALIDKIKIHIPTTKILTSAFDLAKAIFNKQAVTVTTRTISTIDLGWKQLPYEKKEQATLKL
jgi:hypothetical protein